MSFKAFGLQAFREAIDWGITLAELAEKHLRNLRDWEVVSPAQLGVITFRFNPDGKTSQEIDALNLQLVNELITDGFAMINSTKLKGQTVLRFCTINPRTTEDDIKETIQRLDHLTRKLI